MHISFSMQRSCMGLAERALQEVDLLASEAMGGGNLGARRANARNASWHYASRHTPALSQPPPMALDAVVTAPWDKQNHASKSSFEVSTNLNASISCFLRSIILCNLSISSFLIRCILRCSLRLFTISLTTSGSSHICQILRKASSYAYTHARTCMRTSPS